LILLCLVLFKEFHWNKYFWLQNKKYSLNSK
jgi:hypothetical protein